MNDISQIRASLSIGNPATIHTKGNSSDSLKRIAEKARTQKTLLTIIDDGNLTTITIAEIAQAGGMYVNFAYHVTRSSLDRQSVEAASRY